MNSIVKIAVALILAIAAAGISRAQSIELGLTGSYMPVYHSYLTSCPEIHKERDAMAGITGAFRYNFGKYFFVLPTVNMQYRYCWRQDNFMIGGPIVLEDRALNSFDLSVDALAGINFLSHFAILTGPVFEFNIFKTDDVMFYNLSHFNARWAFAAEYRLKKINFRLMWQQHLNESKGRIYNRNVLTLAVTYTIPLKK